MAENSGAETQSVNPIVVHAQYIKDLSFENPNAPESLAIGGQPKIDLDVDVEARANEDRKLHEVALKVNVTASYEDKSVFAVELEYAGIVGLQNVPDEHKLPMLLIEVPRILFPFARKIVADVITDGGFPPLLMHPIDFAELFRKKYIEPAQANAEQAS